MTRNAFGSGNLTTGYYFVGSNLQMTNCQGNGAMDLDPTNFNAQVGGIFVQLSLNVYMKDCQFNDAYGESNSIVNSNLSLNNNFVAENCQFNNARGGEFAEIVAGVHCSSALTSFVQGNGIKWINCQFNGASVSPTNPINLFVTGFLSTCMRGMTFEDCQACNHQGAAATSITSGFYNLAFDSDSPSARFSDSDNITYQNCIASDIEGANNTYGFFVGGGNLNIFGTQLVHNNMVLKNCIAERIHSTSDTAQIAGIAESLSDDLDIFEALRGSYPLQIDLFISDCRVSDVRSIAETPSPLSAGILVQSVIHPVIQNNSVSDCDRGILLTGIDELVPNCFQLAASPDDAVATPPEFINLVGVTTSLTPPPSYSPAPAGTFRLHIDTQSLPSYLQNNNLNLYYFSGAGASNPFPSPFSSPGGSVNNLGPADGVAFLGVQDSGFDDFGPFWTFDLSFLVNFFNGENNVEAAFGFIYIDATIYTKESRDLLISVPIADILRANNGGDVFHGYLFSGPQTFKNLAQGNQVDVSPTQVDSIRDFICPSENLTSLGWQASDPILYNNNGNGNIPELETSTTYYAIVYNPGFSRNGLIQNNKIDNCSLSCYQDDAPTTLSGWVDNTAFNCGAVPTQFTNYDINFAGVRPVDAGTLVSYPVGGNKYFNMSLVP